MIFAVLLFLSVAALLAAGYLRTPRAVLARAGGVSTIESLKKPAITTKNYKPVTVKLSPFRGINFSGVNLDKDAIMWGKAIGNSMRPKGIGNGDFFLCTKGIAGIEVSDVVMIKIDGSADRGGYKLREFNKFVDDGKKFVTFTYGEDGVKRESRPHETKNLVGKVSHTIH